ncbi:MAG: anaerobic ribonucleoside-triphosphate reductase activating protein [Lachnospiraceae bacterium]|nr:anaerobic ribonucleoside-triphosphate reductase activating protein [Lachnospiraceae bacterium]MCM1239941.1 anaerobic ribonucleoside-triphosphate reductase activating protein [Lachnospiraceae bacterium]
MKIHGLQKTTLLDYPGHIAATVFTGGCNFRCPFCQNSSLAVEPEGQPLIPEEEALAHLRKRQGVLEGVCITGGEPTLESGLREFIFKCRTLGYLVKLDTNGYRPEILREFLQEGILDYVAMDIKASPENYGKAAGISGCDMDRIRESIRLLQTSGVPYEFRTTVVRGIHTVEEFEEIGKMLAGSSAYYLQAYRDSGDILGAGRTMAAFTKMEMERMAVLAGKYIDKVALRGVG